jgi:aryl-alcohol dehydrogenase-like predicted oxidoreductase
MKYRLLGRSGLRVSQLFLGAMIFGDDRGWGADSDESRRMIDKYAEAGGNVIDTAVNYAGGNSERIVGELLGDDRDQFVVATTPIDETMRALDDVVRAGKVLYVGISDAPAWVVARGNTLAEWRGWTPFVGLQVPYSLVQREIERDLLPMASAFDLSVAAWSPLAGGVLSGKFTRGDAPSQSRVKSENISEHDLQIARAVQDVAEEIGATPSQVAIAWTMSRSPSIHPIVGARRVDQLEDNLAAAGVTLPEGAAQRLDEVSAITLGFPHDFIRDTAGWLYGDAGERVEPR